MDAPLDPYDPMQIDLMDSEILLVWTDGGDKRFVPGTDGQGRDLLSTILYGTRISLTIGLCAVALQAVLGVSLGVSLGLVAGYVGGRVDNFLMRIADIQLSFSTLMVAIIFLAVYQALFGTELY
jgi:peptide/nickel transport system permease protein